jgi:hypothetical protein
MFITEYLIWRNVTYKLTSMSTGLMMAYRKTPKHVAMYSLMFNLYVKNKRLAVCDWQLINLCLCTQRGGLY